MNAKLMGVAAALVLLTGSGMALADNGKDRGGRGGHAWNDRGGNGGRSEDRGSHDRGRHEGWYRSPPRHEHHRHYYPRWHQPHRYYPHHHHSGWRPRYGYDDGVTIIFKGRLD
jgi:hypothetical protein